MKRGKLKCGYEYEIDENVLDDMELVDAMAEAQDDNPLMFSKAVLILLGKEERAKLYNCLRKDGRVPVEAVADAFAEIFDQLGDDAKN